MLDYIFCIDFGSAYTKVALRPAPQDKTVLLRCDDTAAEFWVPTIVAADYSAGSHPQMKFGYEAAGIKPGGSIHVFTDFKRHLFSTAPTADAERSPMELLLRSPELAELAAKFGVASTELAALRHLVAAARDLNGRRVGAGTSSLARTIHNAQAATHHYLTWLRQRVLTACQQLPNRPPRCEDIPLRLAVPAVAPATKLAQHVGCQRLREALVNTGWKLDERPFVPEPESNAIGILTRGLNALRPNNRLIDYGKMLDSGPLLTVLKGDRYHPTYRALVIDIGAYTTDFAALSVDTGGQVPDLDEGIHFTIEQHSLAYGVTNLDEAIRNNLPREQQTALAALSRKDFEAFQINAYTEGIGYRLARGRILGGPADQPMIQTCLRDFAQRLVEETRCFCQRLGPPAAMQEFILTGGGANIPLVAETLIDAITTLLQPRRIHASHLPPAILKKPLPQKLDGSWTRAASALGGASIYYEPAVHL
ncbi:MAG: hypothetical protein RMJ56_00990 [Gemmataceae bacterium]|nr:hypothetical protein [Gemmata sp.]MDW8196157.1 hypothetical protein [Gemmataceae bacterium]